MASPLGPGKPALGARCDLRRGQVPSQAWPRSPKLGGVPKRRHQPTSSLWPQGNRRHAPPFLLPIPQTAPFPRHFKTLIGRGGQNYLLPMPEDEGQRAFLPLRGLLSGGFVVFGLCKSGKADLTFRPPQLLLT